MKKRWKLLPNQMSTNSNQKSCLLFWGEQIGIKLGRLGSYDILLPGRLDAIFLSESRNLYRQSLCPSVPNFNLHQTLFLLRFELARGHHYGLALFWFCVYQALVIFYYISQLTYQVNLFGWVLSSKFQTLWGNEVFWKRQFYWKKLHPKIILQEPKIRQGRCTHLKNAYTSRTHHGNVAPWDWLKCNGKPQLYKRKRKLDHC